MCSVHVLLAYVSSVIVFVINYEYLLSVKQPFNCRCSVLYLNTNTGMLAMSDPNNITELILVTAWN